MAPEVRNDACCAAKDDWTKLKERHGDRENNFPATWVCACWCAGACSPALPVACKFLPTNYAIIEKLIIYCFFCKVVCLIGWLHLQMTKILIITGCFPPLGFAHVGAQVDAAPPSRLHADYNLRCDREPRSCSREYNYIPEKGPYIYYLPIAVLKERLVL